MKREMMMLAALGAAVTCSAGVHNVQRDTSPDRVKTPLSVDLKRIGTVRPRGVNEIHGQNWRLGCEILDRDYMNFDEYKEHVAPLGIKLVRLQGGWAKCEKEKGKYDFAWLDHIVDTLRAEGVDCAIETSYGNPIYTGGGSQDLAGGFPTSEEGLAGWDAWVDAITKHFAGRVNKWLMWNEPDIAPYDGSGRKTPEQIAVFNIRTAKIVKKNIPDAEITGLSLATSSPLFFEDCLKGLGDQVGLFKNFIYHGYTPAPEQSYANVEKLKAALAKYAPHATMWQGENGCPSEMRTDNFALANIAWSEYSQAKWDMRRMLGDLGHDVPSSVYTICDFRHEGKGAQRGMNNKGLLRANEDKQVIGIKRSYYAVQNVVSVFDDTLTRVKDSRHRAGFGTDDGSLSTYHYVKNDGSNLFVFWTHGRDYTYLNKEEKSRQAENAAKARPADGTLTRDGRKLLKYERPGDCFATRPGAFTLTGEHMKAFKDPVWVDLFTGRVYEFPKANQVVGTTVITFHNVPVYDSPCVLTERANIPMMSTCWFRFW